jgi:hypothetical protein
MEKGKRLDYVPHIFRKDLSEGLAQKTAGRGLIIFTNRYGTNFISEGTIRTETILECIERKLKLKSVPSITVYWGEYNNLREITYKWWRIIS